MNSLIILLILAIAIQNIQSETTASKNSALSTVNSEVIVKNKLTTKKVEEKLQPEEIITAVKERFPTTPPTTTATKATSSPPPPPPPAYNDTALKKNISDLNKRQTQLELYLKLLFDDTSYIKRFLIQILHQNPTWTVVLRRQDGSVDFYRTWDEYKEGFGDQHGEFFIGLDNLHDMTSESPHELLIVLEDFERKVRYAKYDKFLVGDEDDKYAIQELGDYSGDAGDSMSYHRSRKFSTKDQDNDNNPTSNCAKDYKGAWWFDNCYSSHLMGPYLKGARSCRGGINWYHWHNYVYSLKFVEMLIRPIPNAEE